MAITKNKAYNISNMTMTNTIIIIISEYRVTRIPGHRIHEAEK